MARAAGTLCSLKVLVPSHTPALRLDVRLPRTNTHSQARPWRHPWSSSQQDNQRRQRQPPMTRSHGHPEAGGCDWLQGNV